MNIQHLLDLKNKKRKPQVAVENISAAATGPCGCTLKVGEQVIVEGVGPGEILARSNRILTIMSAKGKLNVDQSYVHHLHAYGTSEGVRKEWDTRGRSGARTAGSMSQASIRVSLKKAGFNRMTNNVWHKESGKNQHTISFSDTGAWSHKVGGPVSGKEFGSGDSASSLHDHLAKSGYFGQGAKTEPSWGYGGDEDDTKESSVAAPAKQKAQPRDDNRGRRVPGVNQQTWAPD